jgi:hypothetical protein
MTEYRVANADLDWEETAMAAGSRNKPENKSKRVVATMETVLVCTPTKGGFGLRKSFVQRQKAGK